VLWASALAAKPAASPPAIKSLPSIGKPPGILPQPVFSGLKKNFMS
jgi:hypothetical protein